jgi:cytochrome c oxidase subunit III
VSAVTATQPGGLPSSAHGVHGGRALGWWGMVFLIITEGLFFTILLTSYVFLRFQWGPDWPPGELGDPDLPLVLVMTPILLLSSGPIHWGERGIKRGNLRSLRIGLLLTTLMGATFLGLQVFEYSQTVHEFTPRSGVYGSLFFAITGFHGIHVLVGLVLLVWLQYQAARRRFTAERHLPVQVLTLYWHFVDVVWVFILGTLYVWPNLS